MDLLSGGDANVLELGEGVVLLVGADEGVGAARPEAFEPLHGLYGLHGLLLSGAGLPRPWSA